ncbi:hypothetical protein [Halomicrobium zhouii]|uniref:hypothetical protein n=1 Tax=Halomicrobium zhouii TaxID=767519 RepID=UPI001FE744B1|nr:hypothetical protein [Halomicrobium zhouii]
MQASLRDQLAVRHPELEWETEYHIAGTPVDVAGTTDSHLYLLELEWRRADPADNAAKLFRHLDEETVEGTTVVLFQIFTEYYQLARGGVSSKRKNAEFVGRIATETIDQLTYRPVEFELDPPKRGADRPENWEEIADETAVRISNLISDDEPES